MNEDEFWKQEAKLGRPILLRAVYVHLVGDLATGVMLSQLVYWSKPERSRTQILFDGLLWCVRSRTEWVEELGISLNQYKQAVQRLTRLGLIECQLHMFNGKTTPYIRLHMDVLISRLSVQLDAQSLAAFQPTSVGSKPTKRLAGKQPATGLIPTNRLADFQPTIKKEDVLEDVKDVITLDTKPMDLKDVQAKFKSGEKNKKNIETVWKDRMGLVYDLKANQQPPWTMQQRGQAKLIQKALGDANWYRVVDWVLQHWEQFTVKVKESKGQHTAPSMPQLGYLLKHCDVALQSSAVNPDPSSPIDILEEEVHSNAHVVVIGPQKIAPTILNDEQKAAVEQILKKGK